MKRATIAGILVLMASSAHAQFARVCKNWNQTVGNVEALVIWDDDSCQFDGTGEDAFNMHVGAAFNIPMEAVCHVGAQVVWGQDVGAPSDRRVRLFRIPAGEPFVNRRTIAIANDLRSSEFGTMQIVSTIVRLFPGDRVAVAAYNGAASPQIISNAFSAFWIDCR